MVRTRIALFCALGAGCASSLTPAIAADAQVTPSERPQSEWTITVAPYLWTAGMSGDVGLFGREPVPVDLSFGDVLKNFKFGGMVVGEIHNGTWGVFGDVMYVSVESGSTITRKVLGVPTALSATVASKTFTGTVMGEYRVIATEQMTLDMLGGVRVFSVDNDITASLALGGTPIGAFSGSDGARWADPIVGAKARVETNSPFYLTGWAMVGGLDTSSDLTWDVLGGVGYEWNDRVSTVVGYRAMGVDYKNDGFVYDVVQDGFVLGAVMRF